MWNYGYLNKPHLHRITSDRCLLMFHLLVVLPVVIQIKPCAHVQHVRNVSRLEVERLLSVCVFCSPRGCFYT